MPVTSSRSLSNSRPNALRGATWPSIILPPFPTNFAAGGARWISPPKLANPAICADRFQSWSNPNNLRFSATPVIWFISSIVPCKPISPAIFKARPLNGEAKNKVAKFTGSRVVKDPATAPAIWPKNPNVSCRLAISAAFISEALALSWTDRQISSSVCTAMPLSLAFCNFVFISWYIAAWSWTAFTSHLGSSPSKSRTIDIYGEYPRYWGKSSPVASL